MVAGRGKPGPKPTVTGELKVRVVDLLTLGMSLADVRVMTGLSDPALRREMRADPEFGARVKKAALEGKAEHVRRVRDGVPNWQSSAWFLERKYGTEYGQRLKVDHAGRVAVTVRVEVVGGTPAVGGQNGAAVPRATGLPPV